MPKYKLVMLETPFVSGYAELEEQADRLVNEAIAEWDAKGWDCCGVQLSDRTENGKASGIYSICVHLSSKD